MTIVTTSTLDTDTMSTASCWLQSSYNKSLVVSFNNKIRTKKETTISTTIEMETCTVGYNEYGYN